MGSEHSVVARTNGDRHEDHRQDAEDADVNPGKRHDAHQDRQRTEVRHDAGGGGAIAAIAIDGNQLHGKRPAASAQTQNTATQIIQVAV